VAAASHTHTHNMSRQRVRNESTVTRATYTHTRTQTRTQTPQAKTICHEKRDRETERDISDRFCRHAPIPWRLRSACASMRASVFPVEPKNNSKTVFGHIMSLSWQMVTFLSVCSEPVLANHRLSPIKTAQKTGDCDLCCAPSRVHST
jgi:hypothetical protein